MPKTYLERLYGSKSLSPATYDKYSKNLIKLNDNELVTNINFLKDYDTIIEKMSDYSMNSRRNALISIVSAISSLKKRTKKWEEVYQKYGKDLKRDNSELSENNKKTEAMENSWLTKDQINSKLKELTAKAKKLSKKSVLDKSEYDTVVSAVVLGLYSAIPPRRESDYVNMRISNNDLDDMNNLNLSNKTFNFNKYKTSKTYGNQSVKIPPFLMTLINIYLKFHPYRLQINANNAPFMVKQDGAVEKKHFVLRVLSKIFGKSVGSASFRRTFTTHKYKEVNDEMEEDASKMGTSVGMLRNHYIKN